MARPAINIYGTPIKLNKSGDTKIAGVLCATTRRKGEEEEEGIEYNKTNAERLQLC